jgi:hypothetical protein
LPASTLWGIFDFLIERFLAPNLSYRAIFRDGTQT